jgi:hypothetical protein
MRKVYLYLLVPLLLASKCATKELDFIIENETKNKYYITSTMDVNLIQKYINSKALDEVRVININKKTVKPLFLEVSLDFYESKNGYYVFYIIKQNDLNEKTLKFDSICVKKEHFKTEKINKIFIFDNSKYFKSFDKN